MNERMALCVATTAWPGYLEGPKTFNATAKHGPYSMYIVAGKKTIDAYQQLYEECTHPILAYIHDDVLVTEQGWDERVLREFDDPSVGIVGFGGAVAQGSVGMYEHGFDPGCLCRIGFRSNMRDAEKHGSRFTGECDVAVLDGFSLIMRRKILEEAGGFNQAWGYWCYDYALCCWARRLGYRVRLVGVECHHIGGVGYNYRKDLSGPWEDGESANRFIYDNFKDVLPFNAEAR